MPGEPTSPTSPEDPPDDDPTVTVNVTVSEDEAAVEVTGVSEDEPVVIEVPLPAGPATSLPDVTGELS